MRSKKRFDLAFFVDRFLIFDLGLLRRANCYLSVMEDWENITNNPK